MSGNLENLVYSLIDRYLNGGTGRVGGNQYHERHGMVTSYDPERYLAKVMLMPEMQETGWLGIETGHIGDNYGFAVGLQPGDGKSTGDQVIVRFQEGDLESPKIVQRIHSDNDKPPTVQSGEMVMWAKFKKSTGNSGLGDDQSEGGAGSDSDQAQSGQGGSGQQFYFKNDGSATITDGNGATFVCDGKGNITITCNNLTFKVNGNWISDIAKIMTLIASGDAGFKGGGNVEVQAGGILGLDGGELTAQGGGSVSDGSVTPPSDQPPIPPFTVPA